MAELAPIIEGKPDVTRMTEIDLAELGRKFRMQKIAFEAAAEVFDLMKPSWKGRREYLLAQLIGLVERFLGSNRVQISPPLFFQDELRRRIILTLNMTRVVQHVWEAIRQENTEKLVPVFDNEHPIRSTGDMRPWYTGKPCEWAKRSHVNFCVYDSTWEASEAFTLDHDPHVEAWVEERPPRVRGAVRLQGRSPQVPARLPDPADQRQDAGAGGQGRGQPAEPDQAAVPGRVVPRGQRAGRLRHVVLGCFPPSSRREGHPGEARGVVSEGQAVRKHKPPGSEGRIIIEGSPMNTWLDTERTKS